MCVPKYSQNTNELSLSFSLIIIEYFVSEHTEVNFFCSMLLAALFCVLFRPLLLIKFKCETYTAESNLKNVLLAWFHTVDLFLAI